MEVDRDGDVKGDMEGIMMCNEGRGRWGRGKMGSKWLFWRMGRGGIWVCVMRCDGC